MAEGEGLALSRSEGIVFSFQFSVLSFQLEKRRGIVSSFSLQVGEFFGRVRLREAGDGVAVLSRPDCLAEGDRALR